MPETPSERIERLLRDGASVDQILQRAVREAILRHKRVGNPIVVWREGKVVLLTPDEIADDPAKRTA